MSGVRTFQGEGHCAIHGPFSFMAYKRGTQVVGASCPTCTQQRQERLGGLRAIMETQRADTEHASRMVASGIPPAFMGATFESYRAILPKAAEAVQTLSRYANNFERVLAPTPATGLILSGTPGTGKTHLGCAVVRRLREQGYTARYVSIPSMLTALREASHGDKSVGSVTAQIQDLASVQLLVMDEYGAHTRNDMDYQLLFQTVDARYQRNLPTIMLTNVSPSKIEKELDGRFLERVKGTGGMTIIMHWSSWRKKPGVQQVVKRTGVLDDEDFA